jgi:hypothetical protein
LRITTKIVRTVGVSKGVEIGKGKVKVKVTLEHATKTHRGMEV